MVYNGWFGGTPICGNIQVDLWMENFFLPKKWKDGNAWRFQMDSWCPQGSKKIQPLEVDTVVVFLLNWRLFIYSFQFLTGFFTCVSLHARVKGGWPILAINLAACGISFSPKKRKRICCQGSMSLKSLSFVPALYKIFDEAWLGIFTFLFWKPENLPSVDLGDFRCLGLVFSCSMLVFSPWSPAVLPKNPWSLMLLPQNLFGIFRCFGIDGRIKPLHPVAFVIGFKSKIPDTRSGVTSLHGAAIHKGLPTYCPLDPQIYWRPTLRLWRWEFVQGSSVWVPTLLRTNLSHPVGPFKRWVSDSHWWEMLLFYAFLGGIVPLLNFPCSFLAFSRFFFLSKDEHPFDGEWPPCWKHILLFD